MVMHTGRQEPPSIVRITFLSFPHKLEFCHCLECRIGPLGPFPRGNAA